jgi:oligoendopeptidase F
LTTPPNWDLGLLYVPGSPELERDLAALRSKKEAFQAYRELLRERQPSLAEFGAMTRELEALRVLESNLEGWADLRFSQDTAHEEALAFLAQVREESAELEAAVLFYEIWWKELEPAAAERYLASLPEFDYYLRQARALLEHTLSEPEERIVALKNPNGREALVTLYSSYTNRYTFDSSFVPGGDGQPLNREELAVHFRSHLPEVRAKAYQELLRVYGQDGPFLAQIYQALVRDWRQENVRLRGYGSPALVRHKANDLPESVVASLLRVCQSRGPAVFGRYFQKKAQALGQARLRRYDLYAPLFEDKGRWEFGEAMDLVRDSFSSFAPQLAQLAGNVAESRHLDAALRPNKASGAFCASLAPGQIPWVLMSFKGRTQDLFTLAHELGHAAHSQLAREQNIFQFHASLPLAETASTFGEMLLAKRLLQDAGPQEKEALLFHLMDDAYATVGRQAFFALFETQAHELINQGAPARALAEAYLENLKTQFGQAVEVAPEFSWEWVAIPHFYFAPFYVYAYSFGQLLVYSLWRVYEKEGPDLAQRLMTLLARGGSGSPLDLVAEAGLGPLDDDFWAGGFEVIEGFLG